MKSWYALVQREFLEHRGAFVFAPAALLTGLIVAIVLAFASAPINVEQGGVNIPAARIYAAMCFVCVAGWSAYMLIALYFYFGDSFSADRKNNSLLFWKSMPQSDLKILGSKLLAGATIFPLLILGWLIATTAVGYLATLLLALRIPELAAPGPLDAMGIWIQVVSAGVVYLVLSLLWYAPIFAWVGGLSTVFRGWSIPLSFAIPVAAIIFEMVLTYSGGEAHSALGDFLSWRLAQFYGEDQVVPMLLSGNAISATRIVGEMATAINWPWLSVGLAFTAAATWAASEYRRRRIEA
jgi:ABC-2 type transport system permease protein